MKHQRKIKIGSSLREFRHQGATSTYAETRRHIPFGMELKRVLADRIIFLRLVHRLSVQRLAQQAGVGVSTIWDIEAGRANVRLSTLQVIAEVFNVSPAALLVKGDVPAGSQVADEIVAAANRGEKIEAIASRLGMHPASVRDQLARRMEDMRLTRH